MSGKENQKVKDLSSDQSSEDLGTLLILNKGTNREHYLWNDRGGVQEIGELPENLKKLVSKIILNFD